LYKNKYKWSIKQCQENTHIIWYYPGTESLESLATYEPDEWGGTPMVNYHDAEIGTKEAKASFSELYTLIKERVYGINDVLDDIISDLDSL
jgi:hypothetical protein